MQWVYPRSYLYDLMDKIFLNFINFTVKFDRYKPQKQSSLGFSTSFKNVKSPEIQRFESLF